LRQSQSHIRHHPKDDGLQNVAPELRPPNPAAVNERLEECLLPQELRGGGLLRLFIFAGARNLLPDFFVSALEK